MIPRLGVGVREALTCYLNQVCGGHVLGVGAEPESQRRTQDTVKKNKKTERLRFTSVFHANHVS